MKILFLIGATSRIRNFHTSIVTLADHGHTVRLTGRLRKGSFDLSADVQHERVSARVNPTERVDAWKDFVDLLRGARDYARYFDPRFAQATRLVRRAYEIAPTEFALFCERHPWMKRHWALTSRVLALCEDLIPTDPGFEAFLREEQPDLVLVTPLVTFESYQTDYVKAAHALGVPVVFIPFSWDNLTNKGLVRIQPDRVLVWNDVQRREALELHAVRPDRVAVTGAERFDDFFALRPSTSREEFCASVGLDPTRPILLYLGSSQLTGPNEMELVRRWVEALRASPHEMVRSAGLLIRPHPAVRHSYDSVDYSEFGNVALSLTASRKVDQELYDSLFHAHAAIGLNTSAMLEAAVVGRPVHTLLIPGFDEGQVGTMHFHYLVEAFGGLAAVARDFGEHERQLAEVLDRPPAVSARSRAFAEQFLRPHGIERAVAPFLTTEIERAQSIARRPQRSPLWHRPLRAGLLWWLQRRRRGGEAAAAAATVIETSQSLRSVRTTLEEIQQGTAPVFVGPWNDSMGYEVLYWIPFVRWVVDAYRLPPERLIVLSHDAVGHWYGPLAQRYLDVRTLFSASELDHWMRRVVPQSEENPKAAALSPFDTEILERAARAFDLSDHQVLHPSMFFRVLSRMEKDRTLPRLGEVLRHARLDAAPDAVAGLPADFVAMSASFTTLLPANDENATFLARLIEGVAAEHEVLLVDGPSSSEVAFASSPRVRRLGSVLHGVNGHVPRQVLAQVLSRAKAFVGGHGELALVAASCGVPAQTYGSNRLPDDLLGRLQEASASGAWAPVSIERPSLKRTTLKVGQGTRK